MFFSNVGKYTNPMEHVHVSSSTRSDELGPLVGCFFLGGDEILYTLVENRDYFISQY